MANVNVSQLLQDIQKVDKSKISDLERAQLVLASQELLSKVENPWDTIKRIVWVNVSKHELCGEGPSSRD